MNAIRKLHDFGQSPWYDNLTRDLLSSGGLARLIAEDGILGVTSNPTIFEKAMASGKAYDEQLQTIDPGISIQDVYWELVIADVGAAADMFRPTYDATEGTDGFVSIEVSPDLANDAAGTIKAAQWLWNRLNRPNVMVKIPATEAGLPAIEEMIARGVNINITLIFSLERYARVIDALMAGIARCQTAPGRISSVASFFVSRVDTETDRRLSNDSPLRGRAAVANAQLAYKLFQQRFADWPHQLQRPLWASTSTKNPAYSDTMYVDQLIGPHTVNTLAQPSIDALRDHGNPVGITITENIEEAQNVFTKLKEAGVDFDDVTATLEREGVASFSRSLHDCLDTLAKRREELRG